MVFFCPKCWSNFPDDMAVCPKCGLDIPKFFKEKDYKEKLMIALDHPEHDTAERAARILSDLREKGAVEKLAQLASATPDVFLALAAVEALAKIGTPRARKLLARIAKNHIARMVQEAAKAGQIIKPRQNPARKSKVTAGLKITLRDGIVRSFTDLVLDYNGTVSKDGVLLPGVAAQLRRLAKIIRMTMLTADTFGKAKSQLNGLPIQVRIIRTGRDKADFVRERGANRVIAVGNGRNDVRMMAIAGLSVGVIGPEGAAVELMRAADIVVTDIHHALDLITHPLRVKASLRE
jgi:soluble P-type ATPase